MRDCRLLVYLGLLSCVLLSCSSEAIIARGGDFVLGVDDLRFEVTKLGPSARFGDTYEHRIAVVENLAARSFLVEEAKRRGLGIGDLEDVEKEAEAKAVAQAYRKWKTEKWKTERKVTPPRIKTKPWIDELDRRLHLKDMVFAVYPIAVQALEMIRQGRDFDDLAAALSEREDINVYDLGWVIWKDLSRPVANIVFRLARGEASEVIQGNDGYHIFYLAEDEALGLALELLSMRSKRFVQAMETERLVQAERNELTKRYDVRFSDDGVKAALEAFAISFQGARAPDSLMHPVVATYSDGEVIVADLYNLYYSMPEQSRPYVGDHKGIQQFAIEIMLPELETLAGYDMGLDRLQEVVWTVKKAREDFLVPMMEDEFRSQIQVTDEDIVAYYNENRGNLRTSGQYRARRILLESEDEVDRCRKEIRTGKDFAQLAKEISRDQYSASNGGDLGYLNFGAVAVYDSVIAQLSPGEISDPFVSKAGIEILKLEERTEPRELTLEEARPLIVRYVTNSRANELLAQWVAEYKSKVEFSIDEDLLRRVSLPQPGYRKLMAKPSEGQ